MVNIILIILVPYVQSLQTTVHHNFSGITWTTARDICKPFGLENRHDYLQAIPDEQEFWIGKAIYKEPTPWIEIIGCYKIWETDDVPFYSVASIGTCKQKCDSEHMGSYFGYRKKHQSNCVCQLKFINQSYRSPINSCDSSGSFFVYKEYKGPVEMSSDPGNCTTICCESCNLPTLNINHLEGRRCSSVDTLIVGRCVGTELQGWNLDYFGSLDLCIQNNRLLPGPNYCQTERVQIGLMSWTNVFREEIEIIKTKDIKDDPVRCFSGVFLDVKGQRKLNVRDHRCNENKSWFICKSNSSVSESITQSTLSTIDISKGKQVKITPSQSLTPAKGNTSFRTKTKNKVTHTASGPSFTPPRNRKSTTAHKTFRTTGFTDDQKHNGDNSTSIGPLIGGILGACCILFLSAVLIVCKIRSKGIFKETTKSVKEDTHQTHFSNTIYQDSSNTSDRTSALPLSTQMYGLSGANTPVYAVVNKLKKLENTEATYTDAGYGEYDHLHDIQNRKTCPQENVYDSHGATRNEEDQTYNSSDFGNRISNIDVYDHSFSVVEGEYMSNENHDSNNRNNTNTYDKAS